MSPTQLAEIDAADDLVVTTSTVMVLAIVAAAVPFIVWPFRRAKNALALRGRYGLGPGWAIGGWFVPFANLVLPFVQLRQAAKACDPTLSRA